MALVKLGTTAVGISGTIGGITFARNKAGTYARLWARGSNPRSASQQNTRNVVSAWPSLWSSIGPANRVLWKALAFTPPETDYDPFGAVIKRSGYQWFVRINTRRATVGQAYLAAPGTPVTPVSPVITGFFAHTPVSGVLENYCTFGIAEFAPTDYGIILCRLSPSEGNVSGQCGLKGVFANPANGATYADYSLMAAIRFGYFPSGWSLTAQVFRQVDAGYRSVPTIGYATVV